MKISNMGCMVKKYSNYTQWCRRQKIWVTFCSLSMAWFLASPLISLSGVATTLSFIIIVSISPSVPLVIVSNHVIEDFSPKLFAILKPNLGICKRIKWQDVVTIDESRCSVSILRWPLVSTVGFIWYDPDKEKWSSVELENFSHRGRFHIYTGVVGVFGSWVAHTPYIFTQPN